MNDRPPIIVCTKIEEIVTVLRYELRLSGLTQAELGEQVGLSMVTINRALNGKSALSIEQLYTILAHLGIGLALAPPKSSPARNVTAVTKTRKAPIDLGVTLQDLFRAGKLKAGDILESVPGDWNAVAEVGLRGELIIEDGTEFTSPSTAAKEIRGGTTTNGWTFWALNGKSLDEMRKELLS
jgi:transcriptional regulator with XRE-family HTH domain